MLCHPALICFSFDRSTEIYRNEVYRKLSFTAHLGSSYSCPNLQYLTLDSLGNLFNSWCQFAGEDQVGRGEDDDGDEEGYTNTSSSATNTSIPQCCLPDWRRWRRMPPKILVSMATNKRVRDSVVGMPPNPVQSLSNLLSVNETHHHQRKTSHWPRSRSPVIRDFRLICI